MPQSHPRPLRRLGVISSQAFSLCNFRGPLIREWVSQGIEVFALAPDFDERSRAAVEALGARPVDFRLARTSISPVRDLADLFALTRLLRGLNLDASFAYFIKPAIYGTLAARLAGIRRRFVMIEGAGYVFADGPEAGGWRRRLLRAAVTAMYRVALSGAEKVLFLNRDDVDLFVSQGMVRVAQTLELGGIGVDLEHFAPAPLADGPTACVLAARLLAHKGVAEYVEAARRIRALHPEVRFVLLGSPDLNPASIPEAQLRRWHAEGVVEWQSQVEDVRPWLAGASVFVLPSWYREGVPRSIQEAMAVGRAIVTTDAPGCRDTVAQGENGFLVRPRDVDDLVAVLMRFVDDPVLARRMGSASRARAERLYDAHQVNRRILATMGIARHD